MLITVLACLSLVWLFAAVVIVAVCRMAARGDALPGDHRPEPSNPLSTPPGDRWPEPSNPLSALLGDRWARPSQPSPRLPL